MTLCSAKLVPARFAACLVPVFLTLPASAQTASDALTVERLKAIYLGCERSAVAGSLASAGVGPCSLVYEELKRRGFDGDYGRLRDWYERERRTAAMTG